jgi:2-keto-4-pentenoate hydratase/2-oxohepta-3-ene-1,7-dioic acid hydratase in catechol pathway
MKFASVKDPTGKVRVGLVRDGVNGKELVDLDVAASAAGIASASDLIAFIEQTSREDLGKLGSTDLSALPGLGLADVEWMPPVRRPSKVLGVAINNRNSADSAYFISDHPALFTSPSSAMVGHGQPIVIRGEYGLTHPEAELGVIIGRESKDLSPEEALDAIFGYTIVNDVTSVDLKSEDTVVFDISSVASAGGEREGQRPAGFEHSPDNSMQLTYHARSKGTDTFTPIGPWVVTPDEVGSPDNLFVHLSMNGKLLTQDSTASLRNSAATVVSFASRYFTLFPGDVIHLGTAVSGALRLRDIDFQIYDGPCTIEIEGIGVLSNPIVRI